MKSQAHLIVFLRWLLAFGFMAAGANHFREPGFYLAIMPPYLPWPELLVAISGLCEIAGGIGILITQVRRLAGFGLIAMLVAVFPANLHMALSGVQPDGVHLPEWALWARLPLQLVFLVWVWLVALKQDRRRDQV